MQDAQSGPLVWPDEEFVEYARARQHTLLRAAYLVCGDVRLAEDLVRDALVELARQWDRVREEQPDLFVRRLVYRAAVASWQRRPPAVDALPSAAEVPGAPEDAWGDQDAERRREVLEALDALTPRQRAVVVLTEFEERGGHEVAQVLGCTPATVSEEADAAVARLRTALPGWESTGAARDDR